MKRTSTLFLLALAGGLLPAPRLLADDAGKEPAPTQPAELYEQTDRKKTMAMKLPRTWKPLKDEEITNAKALTAYTGFFGEENKSANGFAIYAVDNRFTRAALARSIDLPLLGEVKKESLRDGKGWTEGCALGEKTTFWRRYVEKNGKVYRFEFQTAPASWDGLHAQIEKMLDTAAIPGEWTTPTLGDAFKPRKSTVFDVLSDAQPDREKSVEKACDLLSQGRDAVAKALPGKPCDLGKPVAWVFQNGTKYEDRVKAAVGVAPEDATFVSPERAACVSIGGELGSNYAVHLLLVGAQQYAWQYFGGNVPIWLENGLAGYGEIMALAKGRTRDELIGKVKTSVAAGKRKLDAWFVLTNWNEVTDNEQGAMELAAWQMYFRVGHGEKKYKKQFDAYIAALHDKGDPIEAKKAFDGVNFDDMLTDFRAWAATLK